LIALAVTFIFPEPSPFKLLASAPIISTLIFKFSGNISVQIIVSVPFSEPPQAISKKKLIKAMKPLLVINCFKIIF